MASTTWVLADHTGKAATGLDNASSRKFTARRNGGRQGEVTLTHDDHEAGRLLELLGNGVPQLRYIRDGQLRLSAYLTNLDEDVSEEGEDRLTAIFRDPYGRALGDGSGPGRILTSDLSVTGRDQGLIGWDLFAAAGALGETGLRLGAVEPTVPRDRSYTAGKNVGEGLHQLTEVLGGFDFDILPLDPTRNDGKLGEYTATARQGQDRPELIWGFGAATMANVTRVERKLTPPVNRVRMVTTDGLVVEVLDQDSLDRYEEWAIAASAPSDISATETLEQRARDLLRPRWVRATKFTPDPDLRPRPFDHYWLGDTGRFRADHGALQEATRPRLNAISITEGPDQDETITLETEEAL